MTEKQKEHLDEVIFSFAVEGLDITDEEKTVLIDVLAGRRTYQEVLDAYIAEAWTYSGCQETLDADIA